MESGMAETLKLTPSESVSIKQSSPELLEVEGSYGPGGSPPPAHFHPAQDEHFEVLDGTMRAKVGGEERELVTGETLEIPQGTPHQMWNPGEQAARVVWQTRPALRTEEWFRSIDALHREGRVGRKGMPGPLAFGALLDEYDDVFRLAGPGPLVKGAVAGLGALGRLRGHKPGA
jgi:mannose-6-phosphate isomerase-like protein (cupin superfamily)